MTREELEYYLGKSAVIFSSQQRALEACLEALGTNIYGTHVALSITAPPWVVSAVLRAGGTPGLLDVDLGTLDYKKQDLEEAFKDFDELIVIRYDPFNRNVPEDLGTLFKDKITININNTVFYSEAEINQYTFSIYNLEIAGCDPGAVLFSKFQDTKSTILQIRSGVLGVGDRYLDNSATQFRSRHTAYYHTFKSCLADFPNDYKSSGHITYTKVKDARKVVAELVSYGIKVDVALQPLHTLPEIGQRFQQLPQYDAEKLYNKIVTFDRTNLETIETIRKVIQNDNNG
jgi:dTDP-4-amino-4,6-dideoxygalactose transaminase